MTNIFPRKGRHNTGVIVVDGDHIEDHGEWSYAIEENGNIVELYGSEASGLAPVIEHNGPNGDVLTVFVEHDSAEAREAVAKVIEDHRERYGECRVWAVPGYRDPRLSELAVWIENGMPDPAAEVVEPEPEPEDGWVPMTLQDAPPAPPSYFFPEPPSTDGDDEHSVDPADFDVNELDAGVADYG